MLRRIWLLALVALAAPLFDSPASAHVLNNLQLWRMKHRLSGQILEFTQNHRGDQRIYSPSLCQCRDVYVYLPPCYNPAQQYPVIFYLHGFLQDERSFFLWIPKLDDMIRAGCFPPAIVIAPDGSIEGKPSKNNPASFFINSRAGNFEDYLIKDVWDWAHQNFPIRPEREAHALIGVSMGAGASFDLGIRHRDKFGIVAGMFPSLNLRWMDCQGRYFGNFDPNCWAWRESLGSWHEPIAKYFGGLVRVPIGRFVEPLFGFGPDAIAGMSAHSPIEHLDRENLKNGELALFVAYAGRDEFNLDAQAESFLYAARCRGIDVTVKYAPHGRHNYNTAMRMLPDTLRWLGCRLEPFRVR
jgi:S-formylglutathione hydrolase FrmB